MTVMNARPRLWTREEYARMVECGVLGEDDPVELIEGEIVLVPPHTPKHSLVIRKLTGRLVGLFGETHDVCVQLTLDVNDRSQPEPDFALVPISESGLSHPTRADLIIEVSFTGLSYDQTEKASLYAKGNMPELWIINLVDSQIEIYRQPAPDPKGVYGYCYQEMTKLKPGDRVAPWFAPEKSLGVHEILLVDPPETR